MAEEIKKYDVFISHNTLEKLAVTVLAERLQSY